MSQPSRDELTSIITRCETLISETRIAMTTIADSFFTSIRSDLNAFAQHNSDMLLYTLCLKELNHDVRVGGFEEIGNSAAKLNDVKSRAQGVAAVLDTKQKLYFGEKATYEQMIKAWERKIAEAKRML